MTACSSTEAGDGADSAPAAPRARGLPDPRRVRRARPRDLPPLRGRSVAGDGLRSVAGLELHVAEPRRRLGLARDLRGVRLDLLMGGAAGQAAEPAREEGPQPPALLPPVVGPGRVRLGEQSRQAADPRLAPRARAWGVVVGSHRRHRAKARRSVGADQRRRVRRGALRGGGCLGRRMGSRRRPRRAAHHRLDEGRGGGRRVSTADVVPRRERCDPSLRGAVERGAWRALVRARDLAGTARRGESP